MGRVCARCGRAIPRGEVHVCPLSRPPSRDRAREDERRSSDSWRQGYRGAGYLRVRKVAIRDADGRCEACHVPVFARTPNGWRKVGRDFGGTHHVVPLSRGGANEASNVVVLCARCHGLAHSHACAGANTRAALLSAVRRAL